VKKLIFLFLVLISSTGYAVNIAYQHTDGEILELDGGNVDRFVTIGDPSYNVDASTAAIPESFILAPDRDIFLNRVNFATKRVERRSAANIQARTIARNNKGVYGDILDVYIIIAGLKEAQTTETDPTILTAITNKIATLRNQIINLKTRLQ